MLPSVQNPRHVYLSAAVQVDTTNILFICGGAFINLDHQVAERLGAASIGFGNPVRCAMLALCFADPSLHETRVRLSWHELLCAIAGQWVGVSVLA